MFVFHRAKIELGDVTPHNIKQLKLLNQVVFPVSYNEKFYKDVLDAGELAKLAYYNDIVVMTWTLISCTKVQIRNEIYKCRVQWTHSNVIKAHKVWKSIKPLINYCKNWYS